MRRQDQELRVSATEDSNNTETTESPEASDQPEVRQNSEPSEAAGATPEGDASQDDSDFTDELPGGDFEDELDDEELESMGFMEEEVPPQFEAFVMTVPQNADGELEGLEGPADDEELTAAEKQLGISLPDDFRQFLLIWNGGTVHQICIYGVGTGDDYDLVEFGRKCHDQELPRELIPFASTAMGDIFCFPRDFEAGVEPPVLLFDEDGDAVEVASSFVDFLERMPLLAQESEQDQQPQPMTVDEWEAFVARERAKLKRLSKTPARELPMPDPEAVRAELKNKIPVDPRHLRPKG